MSNGYTLLHRSVYDNIRRFLQFQMTVNIVALTICAIGAITGFGTPLTAVQLIWVINWTATANTEREQPSNWTNKKSILSKETKTSICIPRRWLLACLLIPACTHNQVNAIMDLMAALALATELPTPDMLLRQPYGRYDHLVNGHMWRNIFTQAAYQVPTYCFLHESPSFIINFALSIPLANRQWPLFPDQVSFSMFLLFGVPSPLALCDSIPNGAITESGPCNLLRDDGTGNNPAANYRTTIIYNTFVWAQLFNEISSRKIYNEMNCFKGVLTNKMFLSIFAFSAFFQFLTVQIIPPYIFNAVPLSGLHWLLCLVLGFFSIPLGMLVRFLPPFDLCCRIFPTDGKPKSIVQDGSELTSLKTPLLN